MPSMDTPIRARGASGIAVASALAAGSGLLISWLAARTLPAAETAEFLVFWGVLFSIYGIVSGVQSETTRAVSGALAARSSSSDPPGARVLTAGLIIGGALAVVVLVTSPLWADRLVPAGQPWTLLALAAATIAYAGHATLAGASAGSKSWALYAGLMTAESLARLAAVAVVAVISASLVGIQAACLAAALVWLGFLAFSARARRTISSRSDVSLRRMLRNHTYALLSAAATAALIVGYPVLFGLTATQREIDASAGLLLAVQLTRAPILIPLQAFQGVAIATFVAQRDRGLAAIAKPILVISVIGVAGAIAAWLVGPWIMLLFGEDYVVSGWLLATLTLAGGGVGVLTLTGSAALADERHRSFTLGWVAATVTAFLMLLLVPIGAEPRVALSLLIAPVVGIAVHMSGIARARPSIREES